MRVAVLALLCGCDFTFQLDHIDPQKRGDGSISGDTLISDVSRDSDRARPPCMRGAAIADNFTTSGTGCGPAFNGGQQNGSANAGRANGELVFTLGSQGSMLCTRSDYDLTQGAMLEVIAPSNGSATFTQLKVFMGANNSNYTEIEYRGQTGNVHFTPTDGGVPTSMQWGPDTRWWRLRREGQMIYGEVSANSFDWKPLGERMITEDTAVLLAVGCGATAAGTWQGARVDNLNVCPD